jgi:cytochrome P450
MPKGTNVMANLTYIHYNPDLWSDPEIFNPDRFLEAGKFVPNENLIPFSVGKRFCLGKNLAEQEFFLFLTGLLHRFQFLSPVPTKQLPCISFSEDNVNTGFLRYPPSYKVILRPRLK